MANHDDLWMSPVSGPVPVPVPAAGGDPAEPQTTEQRAAEELLDDKLRRYGLDSLIPWAHEQLRLGTSPETIAIQLRDQKAFKERFAGMELRSQKGLPAITPAEYLDIESGFKQTIRAAGLPSGFYDSNAELAQFIGNDVSPNEFAQRVGMAREAVAGVDPELKNQLLSMYGVGASGDGELIAYFLDPARGVDVIEQRLQIESAGLSATAEHVFGQGLDTGVARKLAGENVQNREITDRMKGQAGIVQHRLLGEAGGVSSSEAVAAEFGLDSEATARIRRLRQRRSQAGTAQSGVLATKVGAVGLGSASTQG